MKINLNKESAVAAIIAAIKDASSATPAVYVDCNGNCYTDKTCPEENDCLTAEIWRYSDFVRWDEKLRKEVKMPRETLMALPSDELEDIALEIVNEEIYLDCALNTILGKEDALYHWAIWSQCHLPDVIQSKIMEYFDFMRDIHDGWEECRMQGETCPFWYDYSDVEAILKEHNLGIYHGKSITALFDDKDNNMLSAAESHSEAMYSVVLKNLLDKWEHEMSENCRFGAYHITHDGTIYLFTLLD